jgi:uncharacterized protein YciI
MSPDRATSEGQNGSHYGSVMSWWCYTLRPTRADILQTGPTAAERELMDAHWAYTTELHAAGRVALAGRTTRPEDTFAVIVVSAPDEEAARRLLDAEPGVAGGLFTGELYPFDLMLGGPEVTQATA